MYQIDIDSVEVDEDGNMLAIVETKFGLIRDIDLNDFQFSILCKLADEKPVFLLMYYPMDKYHNLVQAGHESELAHIQFYSVPVNAGARAVQPKAKRMSEIEWSAIVARLHGQPPDPNPGVHSEWISHTGDGKEIIIPQITYRDSLSRNQ